MTMSDPIMTPRDLIPQLPRETPAMYERLLAWALLNEDERRPSVACRRFGIGEIAFRQSLKAGDWSTRVRPWDEYLARLVTSTMVDALEETTRDLARRHTEMWARVRGVGEKALERLLESEGEGLSPRDALAFLEAAFKAERLIHGAATEHVAVAVRALDTSGLSTEELRTLRALLAKTGIDAG